MSNFWVLLSQSESQPRVLDKIERFPQRGLHQHSFAGKVLWVWVCDYSGHFVTVWFGKVSCDWTSGYWISFLWNVQHDSKVSWHLSMHAMHSDPGELLSLEILFSFVRQDSELHDHWEVNQDLVLVGLTATTLYKVPWPSASCTLKPDIPLLISNIGFCFFLVNMVVKFLWPHAVIGIFIIVKFLCFSGPGGRESGLCARRRLSVVPILECWKQRSYLEGQSYGGEQNSLVSWLAMLIQV